MEKLIAAVQTQTTDEILAAILVIGGGQVATEPRMVRAALLEVYGQREGVDKADKLMDSLGM